MRLLIFITTASLLACEGKRQSPKESDNLKRDSLQNISIHNDETGKWNNHEDSYVKVDSLKTYVKNVTYSEEFLDKDNELGNYIVKRTRNIISTLGAMQHDSKITLDFFARSNGKLIKTITKPADEISIAVDYIHSTRYGCCGAENYDELSSIWTDEPFLTFNSKYYHIEIPNAHTSFYFGYLTDVRDEEKMIHGILYFSHDLPYLPEGKDTYSSIFKTVNTIVFKAKSKEAFEKIIPFTPEMTLVKNTDKDKLTDYQDHQELQLWSFDKAKSLKGLDFIGLKIDFSDDKKNISIEIPIKDGLLFGDNSIERTIYIDE